MAGHLNEIIASRMTAQLRKQGPRYSRSKTYQLQSAGIGRLDRLVSKNQAGAQSLFRMSLERVPRID